MGYSSTQLQPNDQALAKKGTRTFQQCYGTENSAYCSGLNQNVQVEKKDFGFASNIDLILIDTFSESGSSSSNDDSGYSEDNSAIERDCSDHGVPSKNSSSTNPTPSNISCTNYFEQGLSENAQNASDVRLNKPDSSESQSSTLQASLQIGDVVNSDSESQSTADNHSSTLKADLEDLFPKEKGKLRCSPSTTTLRSQKGSKLAMNASELKRHIIDLRKNLTHVQDPDETQEERIQAIRATNVGEPPKEIKKTIDLLVPYRSIHDRDRKVKVSYEV